VPADCPPDNLQERVFRGTAVAPEQVAARARAAMARTSGKRGRLRRAHAVDDAELRPRALGSCPAHRVRLRLHPAAASGVAGVDRGPRCGAGAARQVADVGVAMVNLAYDVEDAIQVAIIGLRTFGYSRTDIALRLGINREVARQRWEYAK
jgi:hypothetical protein